MSDMPAGCVCPLLGVIGSYIHMAVAPGLGRIATLTSLQAPSTAAAGNGARHQVGAAVIASAVMTGSMAAGAQGSFVLLSEHT
eukprot:jgi/Chrzof1/12501/Cz06g36170.t1